jgi:hypothetical protein
VAVTRCGSIDEGTGLRTVDSAGRAVAMPWRGFDHFQ